MTGRHLDVGMSIVEWTTVLATAVEGVRLSGKTKMYLSHPPTTHVETARQIQSWTKNRRVNWKVASYIRTTPLTGSAPSYGGGCQNVLPASH